MSTITAAAYRQRGGPERFLSTFQLLAAAAEAMMDGGLPLDHGLGRQVARVAALHQLSLAVSAALETHARADLGEAAVKVLGTTTEGDIADYVDLLTASGWIEDEELYALLHGAILQRPGFTLRGGTNEILRLYIALSALKGVGASLSELRAAVNTVFNDPIKGFGVLGGYAERRFTQATGIGRDRIVTQLEPPLRALAGAYERYATELARVADEALRTFGKAVADDQHLQKRIADLMIDLFVGLCVISRADSIAKSDPGSAGPIFDIANTFTRQARRRMNRNIRGMTTNEDRAIDTIAGMILERGAYPWDVI